MKLIFDVVILGLGPAGLQAAIHASRRKVKVLLLGDPIQSSLQRAWVENYCCLQNSSTGSDLLQHGRKQAEKFGAEILEEEVIHILQKNKKFVIKTERQKEIEANTLILATGVSRKKLGVKGEKKYHGSGVSYCVDCDAPFFSNKRVAVVGCGSAAISGALVLKGYTDEVYAICSRSDLDEKLLRQLEAAKIQVIEKNIAEIAGESTVNKILFEEGGKILIDGLFIELGAKSSFELIGDLGVLFDENEFIITDKEQRTNIEGVYAAGDICGPPFQVAKAIGEGCVAGINAADYAKKNN